MSNSVLSNADIFNEAKYTDIDRKIANSKEIGLLIQDIIDTNKKSINKRAICEPNVVTYAICIASGGPKYSWTSCRFPCTKEPNWACRVSCSEAIGCICAHNSS
ncbi:hypothetical protein PIROE2DRAFT_16750 [Piromyces sp. E2]|nr:hypothetical protein PIROE2DRAFT_16750 [Piromyces sp. E2]|eukprot:OUM58082.1 hypothetical protein PIROE2DRAFT_16750 [Piromyces sp. E2]